MRSLIQNGLVINEEAVKLCSFCRKCFVAAASYLHKNLPFNNNILEYVQFLHPEKQNDSFSLNSISNLTLKIANTFGSKASNVFHVSSDRTPTEIVDIVRHQLKMYQLEEIPESTYLVKDDNAHVCSASTNNYWDYALEYCGIFSQSVKPEVKYIRIDDYWSCIGKIIDENGVLKYQQLLCLSTTVL